MRNTYPFHSTPGPAHVYSYFAPTNTTRFAKDDKLKVIFHAKQKNERGRQSEERRNRTKERGREEEQKDERVGLDEDNKKYKQHTFHNDQSQKRENSAHPEISHHNHPHLRQTCEPKMQQQQQQQQQQSRPETPSIPQEPHSHKTSLDEPPYMKCPRIIRISYTILTYLLQITLIVLYAHTLITPSSFNSFSTFFNSFNLLFHTLSLIAHVLQLITLERYCIVYGTWIFWVGLVEGVSVFHKSVPVDFSIFILFWILMAERRNAWGIVVWEHIACLSTPPPKQNLMLGMSPFTIHRLWTLLGVGSAWWLTYLAFNLYDGLQMPPIIGRTFNVWFFNALAGAFLTFWWSFWTFQYQGVVWQREMREGVVVWWSEGLWGAGECA